MATKKPPGDPPGPDGPGGPGGPPGPGGPGGPGKDTGSGTQTLERVKTNKPKLWRVLMHNDDYTTQEFVVHVLTSFFRKDPTEATQIMLKVHTTGKAIVGVYTKDMAESKVAQVTDYARDNGHPLMLTLEPDT